MIPPALSLPPQPPPPPPEIHGGSRRSSCAGEDDPLRFIHRFRHLIQGRNVSRLAFAPAIKACGKSSYVFAGAQIHGQSVKRGLSDDVFVQTSLLSMYSSCGRFECSSKLFDKMPHRNVVSWTAMIDACLHSDRPSMAISMFKKLWVSGMDPDEYTLVSFLSACSELGALNMGRLAHSCVIRMGMELSQLTAFVGTALVDMYCKCGCVEDALTVFDLMPEKSAQSWNAMLHGLSIHGRGMEAIELFRDMEKDGLVRPTKLTFLSLLCGCSHNRLVREGQYYFNLMQKKYELDPTIKHYGCMVDLLGRAGLLDEAFRMVAEMPMEPNIVVLGSLLSSCRIWNNLQMAEDVTARIKAMEDGGRDGDTSHHVILSNIYKQAGLREKMAEARKNVGKKPTAQSWIEIGCNVHEFAVGQTNHPMWGKIRDKLDEVTEKVTQDDMDEVHAHSERMALALGLLKTRHPTSIKIAKNLRICDSCHDMMKRVSKAYDREVIVRDCTRFHHFREGSCSCKDYW